jgi:3',5'-cyclic AMP phosphodiesterase CpdA
VTEIRYVIVSDLHFGAENSVLTMLNEGPATPTDTGFSVDTQQPSPVLSLVLDGLRQLIGNQDKPPTLVLAGDILDLALSPDNLSAMTFRHFARLAFGTGRPIFDSVVHYLPGNHDHHLWEATRETQYTDYLTSQSADAELVIPWHTTKLLPTAERPTASSILLTGLIRSQPGCEGVDVRVSYPNMALRTPDERRCLIVSHGHFTESIYSLMSTLKDTLYPGQRPSGFEDIETLEEENFAWIDFFWSTLGQSGQVGSDMGMIYADLTSPADIDGLVANLTRAMLAKGKGPAWLHPAERWAVNTIFQREANHVATSERGTPSVTLTPQGQAGLRGYLAGPILRQLQDEWQQVPEEVTLVYGHTHKPFVYRWPVPGFPGPVRIYNTGGWVVDTAQPAPVQAGTAVLVNDELEAASVQFYRQEAANAPSPVTLLPPAEGDTASAWHEELASRIDPAAEPWGSLAQSAAQLVAQRHRLQAATVAIRNFTRPSVLDKAPIL